MDNPIDKATNVFGLIDNDIKKRIYKYLNNPTHENWDDVHCIIIKDFKTVWQGVLLVDPTFQRSAPLNDDNTTRWYSLPTPETVMKAIELTVNS